MPKNFIRGIKRKMVGIFRVTEKYFRSENYSKFPVGSFIAEIFVNDIRIIVIFWGIHHFSIISSSSPQFLLGVPKAFLRTTRRNVDILAFSGSVNPLL